MDTGLIARRYARTLADFAESKGEMKRVAEEVEAFIEAYNGSMELREVLTSPVLTADAKLDVARKAFDHELSASFEGFLRLVIRHHREKWLCFILPAFVGIYKQRCGIVDMTLTTAAEVDGDFVNRLSAQVGTVTHSREVRVHRKVDPSLIGGFRFRIDDRLLDASIATQLRRVEQKLGRLPERKI